MSEVIGWSAMALAVLIAMHNFYCSFVRKPLYHSFGWDYRWDSGLPAVGSVCLIVALGCLSHVKSAWIAAAGLVLVDTGGLPWFLAVMAVHSGKSLFAIDTTSEVRPPWTWLTPTLLLVLLGFLIFLDVAFVAGWLVSPRG